MRTQGEINFRIQIYKAQLERLPEIYKGMDWRPQQAFLTAKIVELRWVLGEIN